jgi:hypothetical protein
MRWKKGEKGVRVENLEIVEVEEIVEQRVSVLTVNFRCHILVDRLHRSQVKQTHSPYSRVNPRAGRKSNGGRV